MDEFDLIKRYFAPLSGPEGLGLKDDAAFYAPAPGYDLVITADMMSEGVHFPKGECGAQVAERILRVNLSDLAAKGASPLGYILTLAWPKSLGAETLGAFAEGLRRVQDRFGLKLWGGDTVRTDGPLTVSATLIGQVPTGQMIRRSGAKPGDDVWVSGHIGDGYLGLLCALGGAKAELFSANERDALRGHFYRPEIALELGLSLRGLASAAADISDGLIADLGHICRAGQIGMDVGLEDIPLSGPAHRWIKTQDSEQAAKLKLITAGDDYRLAFTAPSKRAAEVTKLGQSQGLTLCKIGRCSADKGVRLIGEAGREVAVVSGGYKHFES